jgi:hypothetical protein
MKCPVYVMQTSEAIINNLPSSHETNKKDVSNCAEAGFSLNSQNKASQTLLF